jgi:hypothetical protein
MARELALAPLSLKEQSMSKPNQLPSVDEIKKELWYEKQTGVFRARFANAKSKAWRIVGRKESKGYLQVKINNRMYMAHRLAWMYETGQDPTLLNMQIDHIDRDKTNNAFANLRLVTNKQNSENRNVNSRSKTGIRGVYMEKDRFVAEMCNNYKKIKLGRFTTLDLAKAAVEKARRDLFTHAGDQTSFPPYPLRSEA